MPQTRPAVPPRVTEDFVRTRLIEMLCELDDDRANVTSVVDMTEGRIGFTASGHHFILTLKRASS